MMMDMPRDKKIQWNEEVFGKMENLMMLIKKKGCLLGSPKLLPNSLRVLEWWEYPATSLPINFYSKNLVILNLSHSCFQWDTRLEKSEVLRHLIFTGCKNIRQIPDVSGLPNLTELCVDDCTNLIAVHDSVGFLDKLQRFSAKGCTKLTVVPRDIKMTSLEYLCLRDCSSLETFPEILGPMVKLGHVDLEGTAIKNLPSSMQHLEGIHTLLLSRCKMFESNALSNIIEILPKFHRLGLLDLEDSNLTILPACIEECCFLEMLILSGCRQLQEIRGLPLSLTEIHVDNCISLEVNCSAINTLLQRWPNSFLSSSSIILPGHSIPKWFDLSCLRNSVHFWFRDTFPVLVVGAVIGVWDDIRLPFTMRFNLHFIVNDIIERTFPYCIAPDVNNDHVFIVSCCNFLKNFDSGNRFSENKWYHAEVLFESVKPPDSNSRRSGSIKWTGLHINRTYTKMEDVRFTDPYPLESTDDDYSSYDKLLPCETPAIKQDCVSMHPHEEQPFNYEYNNSKSFKPAWTNDGEFFDFIPTHPGESSQARDCVETQNIQDQSLASSSGQVGRELHLDTSSTMSPTAVDASPRNPIELIQDDDVEMEAFYASLDAETHVVSSSHDKLLTIAPSEETKEALRRVHEFISNDASVLLHPEQCSVMKRSLEYLSNLSADDGISKEMSTLMLETSREFTHLSRDYIEANMTIESTTFKLHRYDELETGLESNKHQFKEAEALDDELLQKLHRLKERKKDLEEQINVIKTDISASESEKNIARKRKRGIFQEGKMLKAQRDELWKNTPHLQQEHGLAKERQTRIQADWSKLREKFNKIVAE